MSGGAVLWADIPNEDRNEGEETEGHGAVDESFPARRLRRWLGGMFGKTADEAERARGARAARDREADRGKGSGETGRFPQQPETPNREVPPTENSEP